MHKQPCVPSSASTYETGLACLGSVEGSTTPAIVGALADIAPDLATLVVSVVYGEIYQRKRLSLPQRQLATVAALAAPGSARPQRKFHIAGALNVGCHPAEVTELMMHLAVHAGFPCALNGVFKVKEVLEERGADSLPQ